MAIDVRADMGRHGVTDFQKMETPAKSAVHPDQYMRYISTYREAAQECWKRRIDYRARKFIRRHERVARILRTIRSWFHRIA